MTLTHTMPITETQILKSRYDEAKRIKDAWAHRLNLAQTQHAAAIRNGGDHEAARRNITAVEINFQDAAAELKVALEWWMASVHHTETAYTYRRRTA